MTWFKAVLAIAALVLGALGLAGPFGWLGPAVGSSIDRGLGAVAPLPEAELRRAQEQVLAQLNALLEAYALRVESAGLQRDGAAYVAYSRVSGLEGGSELARLRTQIYASQLRTATRTTLEDGPLRDSLLRWSEGQDPWQLLTDLGLGGFRLSLQQAPLRASEPDLLLDWKAVQLELQQHRWSLPLRPHGLRADLGGGKLIATDRSMVFSLEGAQLEGHWEDDGHSLMRLQTQAWEWQSADAGSSLAEAMAWEWASWPDAQQRLHSRLNIDIQDYASTPRDPTRELQAQLDLGPFPTLADTLLYQQSIASMDAQAPGAGANYRSATETYMRAFDQPLKARFELLIDADQTERNAQLILDLTLPPFAEIYSGALPDPMRYAAGVQGRLELEAAMSAVPPEMMGGLRQLGRLGWVTAPQADRVRSQVELDGGLLRVNGGPPQSVMELLFSVLLRGR
ncbi:MAG: hypothetical protein ACPHCJ_11095 [Oceanococcaceae bacterium]